MELRDRLAKTEIEKTRTNQTSAYYKPDTLILGSAVEMIRGTHIKGHTGIIEAIQWPINPACDADE